mmetsp:Transcript_7780/g.10848  ORF Transcript_7780/g.10848 Transcript_7780/m.10848 type:complete len:190 (-) Transcript_7780:688-1257(-)
MEAYCPERSELLRLQLMKAQERGERLKKNIQSLDEIKLETPNTKKIEPFFRSLLLNNEEDKEMKEDEEAPSYEELIKIVTPLTSPTDDKEGTYSAATLAKFTIQLITNDAENYAQIKEEERKQRLDILVARATARQKNQSSSPPQKESTTKPSQAATLQAQAVMTTIREQATQYAKEKAIQRQQKQNDI